MTSGRYSRLSRPIEPQNPTIEYAPTYGGFLVSVQAQTVLFLLFAILVGLGLLMIVPNLSAAGEIAEADQADGSGNLSGSPQPQDGALAEEVAPETGVSGDGQETQTPAAGTGPDSAGRISPIFTREVQHWQPKILEWSERFNLDPDIIATIMQIESCGDPNAVSHAGAQGLFQVMPFHFEQGENMQDPDTNARRGMAFYNRQLEYTGWNIYLSFAGYNGGYAASGSSYSYWANETQRYYTWAKGIYDDAKAGLQESPALQQWLEAGGGSGCHRAAQRLGL